MSTSLPVPFIAPAKVDGSELFFIYLTSSNILLLGTAKKKTVFFFAVLSLIRIFAQRQKSTTMTIKEAQELVEVWNAKHSVRHSELAGMAMLTEKVGELAKAIAQKQTDPFKSGADQPFADELADIFWETLAFAAHAGVDLSDALIDKLEKKNGVR